MRWLKLWPVILSLGTTLLGMTTWVEIRYAKAADVEKLRQALEDIGLDLKSGQLENRRTVLRGEMFQLKSVRAPTALERQRLFEVENELHDVERQLERLQRR